MSCVEGVPVLSSLRQESRYEHQVPVKSSGWASVCGGGLGGVLKMSETRLPFLRRTLPMARPARPQLTAIWDKIEE